MLFAIHADKKLVLKKMPLYYTNAEISETPKINKNEVFG